MCLPKAHLYSDSSFLKKTKTTPNWSVFIYDQALVHIPFVIKVQAFQANTTIEAALTWDLQAV